jgi:hypothetical protein
MVDTTPLPLVAVGQMMTFPGAMVASRSEEVLLQGFIRYVRRSREVILWWTQDASSWWATRIPSN